MSSRKHRKAVNKCVKSQLTREFISYMALSIQFHIRKCILMPRISKLSTDNDVCQLDPIDLTLSCPFVYTQCL